MAEAATVEVDYIEGTNQILARTKHQPSDLIGILQDVQREFGYIPRASLERISDDLMVPLSRVYTVATFYKAFKLQPTGKHIIKVCLGTACHIKGGPQLMQALESELGVKPEVVTEDGLFSYEGVRCVGCCGLAPVIMVDEDFHGKLRPGDIKRILTQYR
jgi:NADH:ubiquinone oxidoreductase subunit E